LCRRRMAKRRAVAETAPLPAACMAGGDRGGLPAWIFLAAGIRLQCRGVLFGDIHRQPAWLGMVRGGFRGRLPGRETAPAAGAGGADMTRSFTATIAIALLAALVLFD